MSKIKLVQLAPQHIRIDGGTQPRAEINEATVAEYKEAVEGGAELPPAIVFYDGSNNWLADGFHRYHAAAGLKSKLLCEVRPGTRRDAILYSVGANATHGLRRTNADKRKAVKTLLEDAEWSTRSDRWIAETCGVSDRFVNTLRNELTANRSQSNSRIGRDGRTINTAQIGKTETPKAAPELNEDGMPIDLQDDPQDTPEWAWTRTPEPQVLEAEVVDEEDELEAAMSVSSEPDPHIVPPFAERVAKSEVLHDSLSEVREQRTAEAHEAAESADDLPFEEWKRSLAIWRVLSKLGGKAILLERGLRDWRVIEKALGTFRHHTARTECIKSLDMSPLSRVLSPIHALKHPRFWLVRPPCRGGGCNQCGETGYTFSGGIAPERVEDGEVQL